METQLFQKLFSVWRSGGKVETAKTTARSSSATHPGGTCAQALIATAHSQASALRGTPVPGDHSANIKKERGARCRIQPSIPSPRRKARARRSGNTSFRDCCTAPPLRSLFRPLPHNPPWLASGSQSRFARRANLIRFACPGCCCTSGRRRVPTSRPQPPHETSGDRQVLSSESSPAAAPQRDDPAAPASRTCRVAAICVAHTSGCPPPLCEAPAGRAIPGTATLPRYAHILPLGSHASGERQHGRDAGDWSEAASCVCVWCSSRRLFPLCCSSFRGN